MILTSDMQYDNIILYRLMGDFLWHGKFFASYRISDQGRTFYGAVYEISLYTRFYRSGGGYEYLLYIQTQRIFC